MRTKIGRSAVAILSLTLVIASCGSDSDTASTAAPTTAAAADTTAAPAATDSPTPTSTEASTTESSTGASTAPMEASTVTIGLMNHLTGVSAGPYGIPFEKGFTLGLKDIAASGALDSVGVTFKLLEEDVAGEVPAAVTTFNKFVDQGATILVSPNDTPISLAITPLALEKDVLYLTGAAAVKGEDDNTFNMSDVVTPQQAFGERMGTDGVKTAVVILNKDNPAFGVIADAFKSGFESKGGKVTDTISVAAADTDFSSVITKIDSDKPDMVYIASISDQSGNIIAQTRQAGLNDVEFGGSSAWQKQVFDIAGEAAVGAKFARNWAPTTTGDSGFEKDYLAEYGEKPDTYAAIGYQSAWLLASAVKLTKEAGAEVAGTALAEQMVAASTSEDVQTYGPILDFAIQRSGVPVYPGVAVTFDKDGNIVPLES